MIKLWHLLFGLILFATCKPKTHLNQIGSQTSIIAFDIANDTTTILLKNKPALLFVIKEPSCTGCKDDLSRFLSKQKKFKKYGILNSYNSVGNRKNYEMYIGEKFKSIDGLIYSLSPNLDKTAFILSDSTISLDARKSPFLIAIKNNNEFMVFPYEELFIGTAINPKTKSKLADFMR